MPNALINANAQPITKYLDVEIRQNDYNSLEKRIILRNDMLQPIKQVRLTLSAGIADRFLLSDYAFKEIKWYEIVTIEKNGKYVGHPYTGYIIIAAANTGEPAKLIVRVGVDGYTIEVPKWKPPHGHIELTLIYMSCFDELRSEAKNIWQKSEIDLMEEDYFANKGFGNKIREFFFNEVVTCSKTKQSKL